MPIDVQCPGCRFNLHVPDHLAGRRVRCKECGDPVPVPEEVESDDEPARPRPRPRRKQSSGSSGVLVSIIAGVLVAVMGGGTLIWRLVQARKAAAPIAMPAQPFGQPWAAPQAPPAAAAPAVAEIMSLSNPKRIQGFAGRPGYSVDYAFLDGKAPAPGGITFFLVVKSANGRGELRLSPFDLKNQGTISFEQLFNAHRGNGPMEIFIERERGIRERDRVSNIVTLS